MSTEHLVIDSDKDFITYKDYLIPKTSTGDDSLDSSCINQTTSGSALKSVRLIPLETEANFRVNQKDFAPAREAAPQIEKVPATIIRNDEVTVLCEVELPSGRSRIRLAKSLCPEGIYFGMPIEISFHEGEDGIRSPIITTREIDKGCLEQENEAMSALVASF